MSEGVSKRTAIKELLELAKKNGKISLGELNDRLSEVDVCVEDIEKIYEKLEKIGVEIVSDAEGDNPEDLDFKEHEVEELIVQDGIGIDDHVRMYLK